MTGVRQGQSMNEEKTEYRKAIAGTGERGWVRDALNLIRKPRGRSSGHDTEDEARPSSSTQMLFNQPSPPDVCKSPLTHF
jgi:hypothetical protein